jgi:hypothetical protein
MPPVPPRKQQPLGRKVKPAGWLLLLALLGGGLWWAYTKLAPLFESRQSTAGNIPPTSTPVVPPKPLDPLPTSPSSGVLSRSLFPSSLPALPPPASRLPTTALPPLASLPNSAVGVLNVGSEAEAIQAVAEGKAAAAIVSVASVAGAPEAIAKGVKAIWYLGDWREEAALEPGCDANRLRKEKLGAVRHSLAHYQLLAVLAGDKLPEIQLVDGNAALDEAYAKGTVTGGEARITQRPEMRQENCAPLPDEAFAFVVIRQATHDLSAAELSAIVALRSGTPVGPNGVAAFFKTGPSGQSSFEQIFNSASQVWTVTNHTSEPTKPVDAADAVDVTFLERLATKAIVPVSPPPSASPAPAASAAGEPSAKPTRPRLGYSSWLDR